MRWMFRYVLFTLVLVSALSPVLTFARLWQLKEWRFDRLREHLRHEGWCLQLFGWIRPLVVVLGLALALLLPFAGRVSGFFSLVSPLPVLWVTLFLLAWVSLFQIVIGKQVRPVWTRKASAITAIAIVLILFVAWVLSSAEHDSVRVVIFILLPLFSFVFVFLSLVILLPLDHFLKKRILRRASHLREKMAHLTVVGITGSVGKTMTKELLAHILSDRKVLVTPAHVNTELGVASLMLQKLGGEHQIFIVEMGAYRMGEINLLSSVTKPQIGIVTFVGTQHLGLFGSQENLCSAKGELFASLPPSGHAFLNADNEFCAELAGRAACPVQTVGTGGHATFEAFDIQEGTTGISFTLRTVPFTVPILGTHQITNVLLAIAAAESLGVPLVESAKRLKNFAGLPQSFERKEGKQGQVILDDTHNASPESFKAAIEWARSYKAKTKILVTSGLIELGKDESAIHEELGSLSREVFHEVVFLSKNCIRNFEQGYGRAVRRAKKKKFKVALRSDMLIVCIGRMPKGLIQGLLS